MDVDETAITQDDSGLLHAATIARYAYIQNKPVKNILFKYFERWALENELEFVVGSKEDFRWLQRRIVNDDLNAHRAAELSTILEDHEGDDDAHLRALLYFLNKDEAGN